ncbi:MAG: U32 family peptidase [Bacteroides sp.]|nr:U32 family peptidase [Ruminococcus flavefaciens]MCM1554654.1 U32 family peptidase [Bacteroides sp.]
METARKPENPIEIMAPVGSFPALQAALQAGADAVYFGVGQLNMRARAAVNFMPEDLGEIARICREQGVRTYLTLNTVIYDGELPESRRVLDLAKEAGICAVISSDWAVITYARQIGMEVHISTQCNVTNIEAVRFYAQYADVMVAARELSLEQVAQIVRQIKAENICGPSGNLVQIEIFAHGALCMAVSGKCYLSLDYYNSSANRGSCLQLCRRPYKLSQTDGEQDVEIAVDHEYLLSPKDLCTVDFLDKILDAGVSVLKIEGRGRSADYVKTVTAVYKEAVKAWKNGTYTRENIEKWNERLLTVYNRGFWSGYYLGKKMGEWTPKYGSSATTQKTYVGKITNFFDRPSVAELKVEASNLKIGDNFVVIGNTTGVYEAVATEIRMDDRPIQETVQGTYCSFKSTRELHRGDKLYRVDSVKRG